MLRYRFLFEQIVRRELCQKYKGSALGVLWYLVNPLALMAAYGLMFGVLLKVPGTRTDDYLARATALPETDGDAAEYFEPLEEADIARAIRAVVDDPARPAELIARGDARASEVSWKRTAAATVEVYRELL